jgi:hypothetical protein
MKMLVVKVEIQPQVTGPAKWATTLENQINFDRLIVTTPEAIYPPGRFFEATIQETTQ